MKTISSQPVNAAPRQTHAGMLQRQCACGGIAGLSGTCADCQQKKLLGKPLQAKLRINEPGDVYEQEADQVAEQVMRIPDAVVTKSIHDPRSQLVRRRATSVGTGVTEAPSIVHDVWNSRSPGQPLDAAMRAFFEPRFGHDFGNVRVHVDDNARESARAVDALAYTVGRDVVFASGQYAPAAPAGRKLIAHELSHVVQQRSAGTEHRLQRATGNEPATTEQKPLIFLSSGLAATHEIAIDGESFGLVVMSAQPAPEDPAWRYRDTAGEYLGSYPNLGNGLWAFIVRQRDGVLCQTGGNCLGWAMGTYGLIDPPDQVWGLAQQYLDSIGRPVRGRRSAHETYLKQVTREKSHPAALWDYFMATQFHAVPAENDGEAHFALYGRGFGGPLDGPAHIAFRTADGELWLSKPSPSRFPVVHERADQMSGGQTGDIVRLYKAESGPPSHVVLRPKQAEPRHER